MLYARSKGRGLFFNVGGKRESGETDEESLMREVREELGVELVPKSIQFLTSVTGPVSDRPGTIVELKCYSAGYTGTIAPASEIEELAWFSSEDFDRTTIGGQRILKWLKEENLID